MIFWAALSFGREQIFVFNSGQAWAINSDCFNTIALFQRGVLQKSVASPSISHHK